MMLLSLLYQHYLYQLLRDLRRVRLWCSSFSKDFRIQLGIRIWYWMCRDQTAIERGFVAEIVEVDYVGVLKGKDLLIKRLFQRFVIELRVEFRGWCVWWKGYPCLNGDFVFSAWCYWKRWYVWFGDDARWKKFRCEVGLVHERKRVIDEDGVWWCWLGGLHVWNNNNE